MTFDELLEYEAGSQTLVMSIIYGWIPAYFVWVCAEENINVIYFSKV